MSPFERAFAWVLMVEGPETNDPRDPGGLTRFGISQRAHPEVDVSRLTVEGAKRIYRTEYWDRARCEAFPLCIALALFDAAVNQGVTTAVRLLQLALKVDPDGVVGPKTIEAASRAIPFDLLDDFQSHRALRYSEGQHVFRRGWFRRQFRLHRLVGNA